MESTETLLSSASRYLYPNYGPRQVVLDRGEGSVLWDTEGREYLDFYAGIAVSTLGHAHPRLTKAICQQVERLIHQSNHYLCAPNIQLAQRLCELANMNRALFCNSGTEANEAALKLARRYFFDRGETQRYRVISFDNSFHGRTLGALSVTGQAKYTEGFGPIGGVTKVPFGDLDATRKAMGPDVAALITEPIQAEGGVHVAPDGFLEGLRNICDEFGALLILDEIQTGMGRTGHFLYCQGLGIEPDVLTMAKALAGGVPIGAMLCTERLAGALPPGSHGSTFGGNALASAAALATLEITVEDRLAERARSLGEIVTTRLDELCRRHSAATHRRGTGLLQALVLSDAVKPKEVLAALRDAGLLLILAGGNALRLTPALTISDAQLDAGLSLMDKVLGDFSK